MTAYRGSPELLDYSATKGAIVAFTRSLAKKLVEKGIRVNGVAPGPIWTPLIPSTFDAKHVASFGSQTPMKRPGQPSEVAPSFLFLACEDFLLHHRLGAAPERRRADRELRRRASPTKTAPDNSGAVRVEDEPATRGNQRLGRTRTGTGT